MPNKRIDLRKFLVDSLKGKTIAKDNVFNWRIRSIESDTELPSVNILTLEEHASEISGGEDLIHRVCDVYFIISLRIARNEENNCDLLASQIESIVNNIYSDLFTFKYKKTEFVTENLSVKENISCALIYECHYWTEEKTEIQCDEFNELSIEVTHG